VRIFSLPKTIKNPTLLLGDGRPQLIAHKKADSWVIEYNRAYWDGWQEVAVAVKLPNGSKAPKEIINVRVCRVKPQPMPVPSLSLRMSPPVTVRSRSSRLGGRGRLVRGGNPQHSGYENLLMAAIHKDSAAEAILESRKTPRWVDGVTPEVVNMTHQGSILFMPDPGTRTREAQNGKVRKCAKAKTDAGVNANSERSRPEATGWRVVEIDGREELTLEELS
jgi:hypothetical protein